MRLIQKDFESINESFNKTLITLMTKIQFKKWVKIKIEKAAFNSLIQKQKSESKIHNIKYKEFKIQDYLKSKLFSNFEVETLIKLRSKTVELKSNFSKKYSNNLKCSISECTFDESQEHIFSSCQSLLNLFDNSKNDPKYEDIFSSSK